MTSSRRLIIKDYKKPLTAICLQKINENFNEKLLFTFVAYPGDAEASEVGHYEFSGKNSPQFQFSTTKSSLFNCIEADNEETAKPGTQLISKWNHEGLFWSKDFNGTFCCHAFNGKQPTPECAVMRISYVSE